MLKQSQGKDNPVKVTISSLLGLCKLLVLSTACWPLLPFLGFGFAGRQRSVSDYRV